MNDKTCTWTHHRSYGGDYTECGEWFYLTREWTEKFKFCPYCGGRISLASKNPAPE